MIDEIQVQNLALIRDASFEPSAGLTVLTGETGAGKTALLSALKLLMGARANAELVRDGESGLTVSGRFVTSERQLSENEADFETELVITRKVSADGRSRASANGTMVSMRELAETIGPSIDLCGQFEHQQLMQPATHVALFDAWAGDAIEEALQQYKHAYDAATDAAAEVERVREASEASSAQLDDARFALRRIDEIAPAEGEYEQLKHDLQRAEHAESLATAAATAHEALSGDAGALDALNTAAFALESASRVDAQLGQLAASLREAGYVLEDVSAQARDYRDSIDFDPEALAEKQQRYASMQGLLRAYGPRMEDVLARRDDAAEIVALASDSGARIRAAESARDEAETALAEAADKLDDARSAQAPRFASQVTAVMERLQMSGAQLECAQKRLPRSSWNKKGPSSFEFFYRAAESMQPRPLARIASGGEVSRVMLAVKVVLGVHDDVDTLVFDEVDAGVGGAVALSLAKEIADLARTHQVIVVTHLAQVAVNGDAHYVVTREGDQTTLARVEGAEREREIARMLSGSITETSLAHARELLG